MRIPCALQGVGQELDHLFGGMIWVLEKQNKTLVLQAGL